LASAQQEVAVRDVGAPSAGDPRPLTVVTEPSDLAAPSLSAADEATALPPPPSRAARLVPQWLRDWLTPARAWSHTPRALALGAGATVALAAGAGVLLVVVGFLGAGTHVPLPPPFFGDAPEATAPGEGEGALGPLLAPVFAPIGGLGPAVERVADSPLGDLVLQQADVLYDFRTQDKRPLGNDSGSGLLGAFHVVYQRNNASTSAILPGTVAIASLVGAYRDVASATAQISAPNLTQIAADAGLPGLDVTLVPAAIVGDESRALHLSGVSQGQAIGAYLVQFRRSAVVGFVLIAAAPGDESLIQALLLAATQEQRIELSPYVSAPAGSSPSGAP